VKLLARIQEDVKSAMKARDQFQVTVLRMIVADLKNARYEGKTQIDLSEPREIEVVAKYLKKLEKALPDFEGTAKKEELLQEINIVQQYLPKQAAPQEIEAFVEDWIARESTRDFGKIMKVTLGHFKGMAGGKMVSEIIKKKLGQ
jgi:uncharacterized protein